jgi:hypothetical protein
MQGIELTAKEKMQANEFLNQKEMQGIELTAKEKMLKEELAAKEKAQKEEITLQMSLEKIRQDFQKEMAKTTFLQDVEKLKLSDAMDQNASLVKIKTDAAYSKGLASQKMTNEEINAVKAGMSNIELAAFEAGRGGASLENYKSRQQNIINYYNAMITSLDPDSADFKFRLRELYDEMGLSLSAGQIVPPKTTTGSTTPNTGNVTPGKQKKMINVPGVGPVEVEV